MTFSFGIAGWKNSGKTRLVASLVSEISGRGFKVSTIKHAHHSFDLDMPDTDSFKHREAGASEVLLVSRRRWALQHELQEEAEPDLEAMLSRLSPCDLVLVEGYKGERIPKIEIIGPQGEGEPLWPGNDSVKAVACDESLTDCPLPRFSRNAIVQIADFILVQRELEP